MDQIDEKLLRTSLDQLSRKWTIPILYDIHSGITRFNDMIRNNEGLSSKVLAERLKTLTQANIIEKMIISADPVVIEYHLTKQVKNVKRILYELTLFSVLIKKDNWFEPSLENDELINEVGRMYNMPQDLLDLDKTLRSN